MGTSEKTKRVCHACSAPVEPRGPAPADGLSTCTPCRESGIDPRDVVKIKYFELWVRDCVRANPEAATMIGSDVWGNYLCYITQRDADDNYLGRKRLLDLLEGRGLGHRVKRLGYGGIDLVEAPDL